MRSVWNEVFVRRFFEWGGGGRGCCQRLRDGNLDPAPQRDENRAHLSVWTNDLFPLLVSKAMASELQVSLFPFLTERAVLTTLVGREDPQFWSEGQSRSSRESHRPAGELIPTPAAHMPAASARPAAVRGLRGITSTLWVQLPHLGG